MFVVLKGIMQAQALPVLSCMRMKHLPFFIEISLVQKNGNRSNEYIQRKTKYLRNARRLKKETQRKCNEFYKIALLDLNDLELSSLPVGNNHQVR